VLCQHLIHLFQAKPPPPPPPPPPQFSRVNIAPYPGKGGGGCFTAATLVTLSDGVYKRVDELQPGDVIQTFRKENNK
jgi:hypothetical protein